MSLITKVKAFLATGETDATKAAKFIVTSVLPELEKIQADAPVIEGIAALAGPEASNAAAVMVSLLSAAIKAVQAAETAVGASGLSVSLDADLVAAIKGVAAAVKPTSTTTKS